jgi:hypothetical protein
VFDVDSRIRAIEGLLTEGTPASLTYAALEARLALEAVCYDRVRFHHPYIAHRDLRGWKPAKVLKVLVEELEPWAASSWRLDVAEGVPEDPSSPESYERLDWQPLGTQSALPVRRIERLWQALSNVALHMRVPESDDDPISPYGDERQIGRHCEEAVALLREVAQGNMLGQSIGRTWTFSCRCGQTIERKEEVLCEGRRLSCLDPECLETYVVRSADGQCVAERRVASAVCPSCHAQFHIPQRKVDELKTDQKKGLDCPDCKQRLVMQWRAGLCRAGPEDQDCSAPS